MTILLPEPMSLATASTLGRVMAVTREGGDIRFQALTGTVSASALSAEDWLGHLATDLIHRQHPLAAHWVFGGVDEAEGVAWIRIPETDDTGVEANGILQLQQQDKDTVLLTVTPLPPNHDGTKPGSEQSAGGLSPVNFTAGHWQVIEQAKEGFAFTDKEGRFVYMNREHLTMFGFTELAQVLGRPWQILYRPEELAHIKEKVFPVLVERRQWHGHIEALRQDGTTFQEDLTLSLLPDGGIACNCRDRTAEVQMQRRLEHSEALFRGFTENAPLGVFIKDTTGRIRYVNRLAATFLGCTPEQIVGGRDAELLPPDAVSRAHEIDALVMRDKAAHPFELFLKHQGQERWFDVVKFPLFDQAGQVEFICSVYIDTTRRRLLERDAAKVAQHQAELWAMQREFIALVSHEFRTPLTSIQGTHYLLNRRLQTQAPEDEKVRRYLELQAESIATMKELADRVLMLNRIEHTSADRPDEPVAITQVLAKVVAHCRETETQEPSRIRLESALPESATVVGDAVMLRSALENLIGNALKFSPPEAPVQVEGTVEQEQVVIRVSDRGRGIPQPDQARLFEPFVRASNVGMVAGTGLGLSIVKRVADLHRGRIEYRSTEGEGSVFSLMLPLAGEAMGGRA